MSSLVIAYRKYDERRDPHDHWIDRQFPVQPGPAHAYGSARSGLLGLYGAEEKDGVLFHDGAGPVALCGVHVQVTTRMTFPVDDPDSCPRCVKVTRGEPIVRGRSMPRHTCGATLVADDKALSCSEPFSHKHMHRAGSGEQWETGWPDFIPAPHGYV